MNSNRQSFGSGSAYRELALAAGVDHDHLARLDVAHEVRADDVERARLAGEHPATIGEAPEHERPEAVRVAHADEVRVVHQHEREPALQPRQHLLDGVLEVTTVGARLVRVRGRDQLGDQRGVAGGVELALGRHHAGQHADLRGEVLGVREVAVVAEREPGVADRAVHGLRVAPRARSGRRVAHVSDREVPLERDEVALVEHLRDEAHVLHDGDELAVAHRDAGRLLPAVLERVEPEVGEVRRRSAPARTRRRHHTRDRRRVPCALSIPSRSGGRADRGTTSGGDRFVPEGPGNRLAPGVRRVGERDVEGRRPEPVAAGATDHVGRDPCGIGTGEDGRRPGRARRTARHVRWTRRTTRARRGRR